MENMSHNLESLIRKEMEETSFPIVKSKLAMILADSRELPSIIISWSTIDIIDRAKERDIKITEEQALEILNNIKRGHDCNIGINWDVIDCHIDML